MDQTALQEFLLNKLIETNAIVVRQKETDMPFWYTSGLPGPFYIQTQNIVGKEDAAALLDRINVILDESDQSEERALAIWNLVVNHLNANSDYYALMDRISQFFEKIFPGKDVVISGGERRDWFFSIPISILLNIPHIFLWKSGRAWLSDAHGNPSTFDLQGANVIHVTDLINQASSYTRAWIPGLKNSGCTMSHTFAVVVRDLAGVSVLNNLGISVLSPVIIDTSLFRKAHQLGLITSFAVDDITLYYESSASWTDHLLQTAEHLILEHAQAGDLKTRARIHNFVATDPYKLAGKYSRLFYQLEMLTG